MPTKIRDLTSEELVAMLKARSAAAGNKLVAADELHKRGRALPLSREQLTLAARSLSRKEQHQCYAKAHQLSLSTLQLVEWIRYGRNEETRKWSYSLDDREHHQIDLAGLVHELQRTQKEAFIWNEWMDDWTNAALFKPWLTEEPFRFEDPQKEPSRDSGDAEPAGKPESQGDSSLASKSNSPWPIFLGILAVLGTPFWVAMIFTSLASGYQTFLGPILPVIFSLVMSAMSIPVAIGIFQRRKWAWGFYVYSTLMALIWFGGHFLIDDAGPVWLVMTVFAGIMLTFATIAKDEFQ